MKKTKKDKMKTVYQWRYKNRFQKHWKIARTLLSECEAYIYFDDCQIEKLDGKKYKVEVNCD